MAVLDAGSSWTALAPGLTLAGIGTGLVAPGLAGAALAAVPPANAGMAGGAVNTFRQLGYAVGVALFGTVLTSRMADSLGHDAAHAVAGGGAPALRGTLSEQAIRAAFARTASTGRPSRRASRGWSPGCWCSSWCVRRGGGRRRPACGPRGRGAARCGTTARNPPRCGSRRRWAG